MSEEYGGYNEPALKARIAVLERERDEALRQSHPAYKREHALRAKAESDVTALSARLAAVERELRLCGARGADLTERAEKAEATLARVQALSTQWRHESKPDPNGKIYIDLRRCADDLDALLAGRAEQQKGQ